MSLQLIFLLLVVLLLLWLFYSFVIQSKTDSFSQLKGKHVFITGGSKGIGYELARIAVKNGANVTIVARNKADLVKAKLELIKLSNPEKQVVMAFSADISENIHKIEQVCFESEDKCGPINLLACCAGTAIAKTFDDCTEEDFRKMMNINYFGCVNTIKACLVSIRKTRNGKILLFSSLGGLFGLYGYSAYAASKFALVGLAEVLAMELLPSKISVTVSFPPDTDTPGFAVEQVGKPELTKLISEEGGLFSPQTVAQKALVDTLQGEFISTVGFNGFLLTSVCAGMMPTKSWWLRAAQVVTMGPFRLIGLFFLNSCSKMIKNKTE